MTGYRRRYRNESMNKLLLPMLLAALALAACGNDEPAAPAPEATPAPEAVAPEATPAPQAAAPAEPAPKVVTMNMDEIGVQPAKNIQDAFNSANLAMDRYCEQEGLERKTFYIKGTDGLQDRWRVTFFGAPGNVAMYVYVDVYPDGRFEIVR
jgi:hypothetical protein